MTELSDIIKKRSLKKPTGDFILEVSIDSEWDDYGYLTLQIYIPEYEFRIVVINSQILKHHKNVNLKRLTKLKDEYLETSLVDQVYIKDLETKKEEHLHFIIKDFLSTRREDGLMPQQVKVFLFSSLKDLYPCFGWSTVEKAMLNKKSLRNQNNVYQLRNIKGSIYCNRTEYKLFDLQGLISHGSLHNLATTFNIKMSEKEAFKAYKANMFEPMFHRKKEIRVQFLTYAVEDSMVLTKIFNERFLQHDEMLKVTFSMPEEFRISRASFPSTIGSLVSMTFQNWLLFSAQKKVPLYKFKYAVYKFGYLDDSRVHTTLQFQKIVEKRAELLSLPITELHEKQEEILKHFDDKNYELSVYNLAGVKHLVNTDRNYLTCLSASVVGGRTNNEHFWNYRTQNVLDIDFQGAYSMALQSAIYPIGRPSIFKVTKNHELYTLKYFLDLYKTELIPKLWVMTVSTEGKPLTFCQDLLYSKVIHKPTIENFTQNSDFDLQKEPSSDHVLIKQELYYAILTSDILDLILAIATNDEKKEIYSLKVKNVIFWTKSDQVDTIEEWTDLAIKYEGEQHLFLKWVGIPLSGFVKPLIQKRKEIQVLERNAKNIEEKLKYKCSQTSYKLTNNTLYGDICSTFFPIGNVCLGNVITGLCRSQIWLVGKFLDLSMTLTDGGIFSPQKVLYLKHSNLDYFKNNLTFSKLENIKNSPTFSKLENVSMEASYLEFYRKSIKNPKLQYFRKPGFDRLANVKEFGTHRHSSLASLGQYNWDFLFKNPQILYPLLNQIEKDVNFFLKESFLQYGLELRFNIELKKENCAETAITFNKGNYVLKRLKGDVLYKIRGFKELNCDGTKNAFFKLFDNLLEEKDSLKNIEITYQSQTLLTIKDWVNYRKKEDFTLRPGDMRKGNEQTLKFNPTGIPLLTLKGWLARKKFYRTCKIPYYEHFSEENITNFNDMILHMTKRWIQ